MEMFLAFFACRTAQLCPISFLQHHIIVNVLDIIFRCINAKMVLDSTFGHCNCKFLITLLFFKESIGKCERNMQCQNHASTKHCCSVRDRI